jgi:hypothetical protein
MSAPSSIEARAGSADVARAFLLRLADLRAWLFLAVLLVFFESWAQVRYGTTFLFATYNAQSIAIFAVAPLLLALGSTFVIISGGMPSSPPTPRTWRGTRCRRCPPCWSAWRQASSSPACPASSTAS